MCRFVNIFPKRLIFLVVVVLAVCVCAYGELKTESKWNYKRNFIVPATKTNLTDIIMRHIGKRTSVFEPGTGRSFLATLCLFIFKIIKIACLCSFLLALFLILCPLLPLLIPALLFFFIFTIPLVVLVTVAPPVVPVVTPTIPPEILPPFTSIPALLK